MAKNKSANEIILNLEYEKEVSTLLIALQNYNNTNGVSQITFIF